MRATVLLIGYFIFKFVITPSFNIPPCESRYPFSVGFQSRHPASIWKTSDCPWKSKLRRCVASLRRVERLDVHDPGCLSFERTMMRACCHCLDAFYFWVQAV